VEDSDERRRRRSALPGHAPQGRGDPRQDDEQQRAEPGPGAEDVQDVDDDGERGAVGIRRGVAGERRRDGDRQRAGGRHEPAHAAPARRHESGEKHNSAGAADDPAVAPGGICEQRAERGHVDGATRVTDGAKLGEEPRDTRHHQQHDRPEPDLARPFGEVGYRLAATLERADDGEAEDDGAEDREHGHESGPAGDLVVA
jgi:hypothetical protein